MSEFFYYYYINKKLSEQVDGRKRPDGNESTMCNCQLFVLAYVDSPMTAGTRVGPERKRIALDEPTI